MRALFISTLLLTFATSFLALDDKRPLPPPITPVMIDGLEHLPGDLNALPAVSIPSDNPQTSAKIDLGKRLFFDTRLSVDEKSSCATCHQPAQAYTDGLSRSRGSNRIILRRNSPTLLNAAFNHSQFWDGRAASLEDQCKSPLLSPMEMGLVDEAQLVTRLRRVPGYRRDFQAVFGGDPTLDKVTKAIAAFERTLITPGSRFDRYALGDKTAFTEAEKRGLIVFVGKGTCSECHKSANFTDDEYHKLGEIAGSGSPRDLGRFEVTNQDKDRGAFKTPTLRNVALTAPYMHDGSFATLEEVIDFYDRGGDSPDKSDLIFKLDLTIQDKADLLAFLKTLTGTLPQIQAPPPYADESTQPPKGRRH